jgi:multicomponent Na+:H+ antiporter subunit B
VITRNESIIMDVVTRIMVPIIQIFALYVIFHGHYSPGGGFQGGALLAASVLLQRVVLGSERSQMGFPTRLAVPFAITGILIYVGTGLWSMPFGGNFLEYDQIPLDLAPDWLRNTGILLVEIGIAFAVMGALVSIFDDLASGGKSAPEEDASSPDGAAGRRPS